MSVISLEYVRSLEKVFVLRSFWGDLITTLLPVFSPTWKVCGINGVSSFPVCSLKIEKHYAT